MELWIDKVDTLKNIFRNIYLAIQQHISEANNLTSMIISGMSIQPSLHMSHGFSTPQMPEKHIHPYGETCMEANKDKQQKEIDAHGVSRRE